MVLENTKYPIRMGEKWSDQEDMRLLKSIQEGKDIEIIACEHQRTVGGVNARRHIIATNYYFNNQLSIEQIIKYTGLTRYQIEDAIKKREMIEELKMIKNPKKTLENDELIYLLNILNQKLDIIIENTTRKEKIKNE